MIYSNAAASEQWRSRVGKRWEHVCVQGRLRADNGDMLVAAAAAGMGVTVLPTFIAGPMIASGALEVLLPDHPPEAVGRHAVMPPGRGATARV